VLSFYQQRGYDFVSLTDHNRVTVVKPPDGLLLIPGVELSQNSTICEPAATPGYRCLFHTSGLFVDPALDSARGERIPMAFRPGRSAAYEQQLGIVSELEGIGVINHPMFHFAANARLIRSLAAKGVKLVELWNASLDQQHPGSRQKAEQRAEELWDEILSGGTLVYGVATDDAHHFSDAVERARQGKFAYVGDRAWVMVRAEKEPAAIRAALLGGDFYSTTGVVLDQLVVARDGVRVHVASAGQRQHTLRFVGRGGRELSRSQGDGGSYVPRGDEGYVRAVIEDPEGRKAWTQPVMIAP